MTTNWFNFSFELPVRLIVMWGLGAGVVVFVAMMIRLGTVRYLMKKRRKAYAEAEAEEEKKQQRKKEKKTAICALPDGWRELYDQLSQLSYYDMMADTIESFCQRRGLPILPAISADFLCRYCLYNPGNSITTADERRMKRISASLAPHISKAVVAPRDHRAEPPRAHSYDDRPRSTRYCWERNVDDVPNVSDFWEHVVDEVNAALDPAAKISSFVAMCKDFIPEASAISRDGEYAQGKIFAPNLSPADVDALIVKVAGAHGGWDSRRLVAFACERFIALERVC